jgi:hypothetical protein
MSIRSVRNNNPGNLDAHEPWQGLMPREKMNAEQRAEPRFAVFVSPEYGFRALCKVLLTYQSVHGLDTIEKIINRWAPPSENPTKNYVAFVAHALQWPPNEPIKLQGDAPLLAAFAKAISMEEAGGWFYTDAQVQAGARMALGA